MMKKLLLALLLFPVFVFTQERTDIDIFFDRLYKAETAKDKPTTDKLFAELNNYSPDKGEKITRRLLWLASKKDNKSLYLRLLIFSHKYYKFEKQIGILNRASTLAKEEDDLFNMGVAEMTKGMIFRDNLKTDSAMISVLKARHIFREINNVYELVAVSHLIADLHYYAGQYDKAEEIYKEILQKHGDPAAWKEWRQFVVTNNLGLIRIQQQRFNEAEEFFKNSLNIQISGKKNPGFGDSVRICYVYRKLLHINLLKKDYNAAEKYYSKAFSIAGKLKLDGELEAMYVWKAGVCTALGEFDSALVFLNKAKEYNFATEDLGRAIDLYYTYSTTYSAMKDYKNAYHYFELFEQRKDSADAFIYRAKYMNIYAEDNYNNYLAQIANYKREKLFLITIIILTSLSLLTIAYFYGRYRISSRRLVKKNIEVVKTEDHKIYLHLEPALTYPAHNHETDEHSKKRSYSVGEGLIDNILGELDQLMTDKKLYLQPEISINDIADELKTNRTYLSKAINSAYNVNFTTYINELRIKEAIRLISSGEHKNFNIEGIAQKAGFNNRVSFTKAFQKYTGITPSFFIKNADNGATPDEV